MQRDFQSDLCHRRLGTSAIGKFITFIAGQLTGQTVRVRLEELQKPKLGRKFTSSNGRPIDPPPVVCIRLFRVNNPGTSDENEDELECEAILDLGLTCYLDLFPIPSSSGASRGSVQPPPGESSRHDEIPPRTEDRTAPPLDVITINGHTITEGASCTDQLVGIRIWFIPHPNLTDNWVITSIITLPQAIAAQLKGAFVLRYRSFSLLARVAGEHGTPVIAECFSEPFTIYSCKRFPGFPVSTELTKYLSTQGIRTRVREQPEDGRHHRETIRGQIADGNMINNGAQIQQRDEADSHDTDDDG
ncbi:hypothetical protein CERSUDRAFT_94409 [Gelatoporia subvermispora B]|uniref:Velvet domain-containing protein n=1 Tax=Ceriporiopsis subvermispora (strain B) TaxID=914234 RepID=M2RG17_CERS8|nr:hypothetical protein CERSUDRAFT_94409 [Gelatoporia subvermispora B]